MTKNNVITKSICRYAVVFVCSFAVCVSLSRSAFAEVGYSMRGDSQPFHQWDGAFNGASSRDGNEGFIFKSGAFSLRPHLGVWGGYIDNVYLTHDNETNDTYYTVAPGLMLVYGNESANYITLNYVHEINRYSKAKSLDYDGDIFSIGLNLTPGQFRIHLSDQFSNTIETDEETSQNQAKLENVETLTVSRHLSQKTSFMASQRYVIRDYRDDNYLDYDELFFGGNFYHRTFPKVKTFVGGGYGMIDMKDSMVIGDADYVKFNVGLQGRLTAKTTLHSSVGLEHRTFDDDIKTIDEWTALVGISSRYSDRTYWGLDISRGLIPSSKREGYTRVSTSITPSFRHILWHERLSVSLSGSYEIGDYYSPTGAEDYSDKFWYVTGVVDWHPLQPFTVGLGYTYSKRDSDRDEYGYEQNHIFLRGMLNY